MAAVPAVRAALLPFQRRFGGSRGAVLAGRDIGTVVRPDATFKLFVVASEAERRGAGTRSCGAAAMSLYTPRFWRYCWSAPPGCRTFGRADAHFAQPRRHHVLDTTALDAQAAFAAARDHIEAGMAAAQPGR